jgi:hypothetical protein
MSTQTKPVEVGERILLVDTLKNHKDGNKYGVCTLMEMGDDVWTHCKFEVKVVRQDNDYWVFVKDGEGTQEVGDIYRKAGVLRKVRPGDWMLYFADSDTGEIRLGYRDRGTVAHYAHTIVSHYVGTVVYRRQEAAAKAAQPQPEPTPEPEPEHKMSVSSEHAGSNQVRTVTIEIDGFEYKFRMTTDGGLRLNADGAVIMEPDAANAFTLRPRKQG